MNVNPFKLVTSTSSLRGELVSETAIYNDTLLMVKTLIFENRCTDVKGWGCRLVKEGYYTFLPVSKIDSPTSEEDAFTIFTNPYSIFDIYHANLKKHSIEVGSKEAILYLMSLYKASVALVTLMRDNPNAADSITASIYSIYSLYLKDYVDDIESYTQAYVTQCTENFSKENGESVVNIVIQEILSSIFNNLNSTIFTYGYNADKLAQEVSLELSEIFHLVNDSEDSEHTNVPTKINKLSSDPSKYACRDIDMTPSDREQLIERLEQSLVYYTDNDSDCETSSDK